MIRDPANALALAGGRRPPGRLGLPLSAPVHTLRAKPSPRGLGSSLLHMFVIGAMVAGMGRPASGRDRDPLLAPALPIPSPDSVDASVTQSTGAATLRIPIEVPPGPGGFQPKLALVYSSHRADGPFGVGWELPLDEIRCAIRSGVPDYAQGCAEFELNGQTLVKDPATTDRYHTFVESFQRVKYTAGTNSWEVTHPDGTKLRFGTDPAHRVHVANDPGQPAARWLLAEMLDPHGNTITFTYDRSDPGNPYPEEVSYGVGGRRKIQFIPETETRPDPSHDFAGGIERWHRQRIREIRVLVGTNVFQRRVLSYDDTGYSTGRSRLTSTQLFGTDCDPGAHPDPTDPDPTVGCTGLPAQQFRYTDPDDALGSSGLQWASEPTGSPWLPPVDFFIDADFGQQGDAWWYGGVQIGDVNGDGLVDLVQALCDKEITGEPPWIYGPCDDATEGTRAVYLNNGSGWEFDPGWSDALEDLEYHAPILTVWIKEESVDQETICNAVPDTVPRKIAFSELRWSHAAISTEAPGPADPTVRKVTFEYRQAWDLVDLNGDGLADLVSSIFVGGASRRVDCFGGDVGDPQDSDDYVPLPGAEARVVFLNTGSGWEPDPELAANLPPFDGINILRHYSDPSGPGRRSENPSEVSYCDDSGQWDSAPDGTGLCISYLNLEPRFVELNGDGRLDLIARTPTQPGSPWLNDFPSDAYHNKQYPARSDAWIQVQAANGSGWVWVPSPAFNLPFQHVTQQFVMLSVQLSPYVGGEWTLDGGVRFADLNRDGLTDVLWTDPFLARDPVVEHAFSPRNSSGVPIARGVLLNTGAGWCASYDSSGSCEDADDRYLPLALARVYGLRKNVADRLGVSCGSAVGFAAGSEPARCSD